LVGPTNAKNVEVKIGANVKVIVLQSGIIKGEENEGSNIEQKLHTDSANK